MQAGGTYVYNSRDDNTDRYEIDGDDELWAQYEAEQAEAHRSYKTNMMTTVRPNIAHNTNKGMIDTGTNVNVSNKDILTGLGYTLYPTTPPIHITFGNDTASQAQWHARIGGIIGNIYVIDTAKETLLSTKRLEAMSYSIYMHQYTMTIRDNEGNLACKPIKKCIDTDFYYMEIPRYIGPSLP